VKVETALSLAIRINSPVGFTVGTSVVIRTRPLRPPLEQNGLASFQRRSRTTSEQSSPSRLTFVYFRPGISSRTVPQQWSCPQTFVLLLLDASYSCPVITRLPFTRHPFHGPLKSPTGPCLCRLPPPPNPRSHIGRGDCLCTPGRITNAQSEIFSI
jgi:hypothetical protein